MTGLGAPGFEEEEEAQLPVLLADLARGDPDSPA
jgi:hypothetical protein